MTAPAPGQVRPLKRKVAKATGKLTLLEDDIHRVYGQASTEKMALLHDAITPLQKLVALLDDDSGTYTPEQVAARKEARAEEQQREDDLLVSADVHPQSHEHRPGIGGSRPGSAA